MIQYLLDYNFISFLLGIYTLYGCLFFVKDE